MLARKIDKLDERDKEVIMDLSYHLNPHLPPANVDASTWEGLVNELRESVWGFKKE